MSKDDEGEIVDFTKAKKNAKATGAYERYKAKREKERQELERAERNKNLAARTKDSTRELTPEEKLELESKNNLVTDSINRLNGLMRLIKEQQLAKRRSIRLDPKTGEVVKDDS